MTRFRETLSFTTFILNGIVSNMSLVIKIIFIKTLRVANEHIKTQNYVKRQLLYKMNVV